MFLRLSFLTLSLIQCLKTSLWEVPALDVASLDEHDLSSLFTSQGVLAVKDPALEEVQQRTLESAHACMNATPEFGVFMKLNDSRTTRRTVPSQLSQGPECPAKPECRQFCAHLERLRVLVNDVVRRVGTSLAHTHAFYTTGSTQTPLSAETLRVWGFENKLNLEHVHIYTPPTNSSEAVVSLPSHIDSGLMLATVAPLFVKDGNFAFAARSEFVVKCPDGQYREVSILPGAVLMVPGEQAKVELDLEPVWHYVEHTHGQERVWYGQMYSSRKPDIPLNNRRKAFQGLGGVASVVERDGGMIILKANTCPSDEPVQCWMGNACVSEKDQCTSEKCGGSFPAVCLEPKKKNRFCNPEIATDMVMTGFTFQGHPEVPCIILFFPSWVLDTVGKFVAACFGCLFLGVLTEFIVYSRRAKIFQTLGYMPYLVRELVVIVLYGLNISIAYLLMLVAMTYSYELFFMVILGLMIGHFFFNRKQPVTESVEPCCAATEQSKSDIEVMQERFIAGISPDSHVVKCSVQKMKCMRCVNKVTDHLLSVRGIDSVFVNLEEKTAVVAYNTSVIGIADIIEEISSLEYSAHALQQTSGENGKEVLAML